LIRIEAQNAPHDLPQFDLWLWTFGRLAAGRWLVLGCRSNLAIHPPIAAEFEPETSRAWSWQTMPANKAMEETRHDHTP
jgi:hypothetical protein